MRDNGKRWIIILFAGILAAVVLFVVSYQLAGSNREFGIYLMESNELVISDKGIVSYNATSHTIKLNQEGIDEIKTLKVAQKPFAAKLNGRIIYYGSFWSDIFSVPHSGIVIIDILAVQNGSTDTIRVEPCYPSLSCQDADLRNNQELFSYLESVGKLIR